jgi:hypothetical protein
VRRGASSIRDEENTYDKRVSSTDNSSTVSRLPDDAKESNGFVGKDCVTDKMRGSTAGFPTFPVLCESAARRPLARQTTCNLMKMRLADGSSGRRDRFAGGISRHLNDGMRRAAVVNGLDQLLPSNRPTDMVRCSDGSDGRVKHCQVLRICVVW